MKMTAGAQIAAPGPRTPSARETHAATHEDAFRAAAADVTDLVTRLRKGRDLLATMDGAAAYRAEAEALWKEVVLDLYLALREAYAHYAILRQLGSDEGAVIDLFNAAMPNVDDLTKLGVKPLFDYYRGRQEKPEWVTRTESRLIGQVSWPPVPGEDIWDTGVRRECLEEPPF